MTNDSEKTIQDVAVLVSQLPKGIDPPADLWPGIEARLGEQTPPLDSQLERLPKDIDSPTDLWPGIEARLAPPPDESGRGHGGLFGFNVAAGIGFLAVVGTLLILTARVNDLASDTGAESVAAAAIEEIWWLAQLRDQPNEHVAVALEVAATTIRENFLVVREERRAIERAIDGDVHNARLWELWRHAYKTELVLTNEMERIVNDYQRGYGI